MTTPDGPIWELVKAEFRATWCGRWRWLWWLSAIACVATAALIPQSKLMGPMAWLIPLWLPVYWAPIVLGADLLCLRFSENPQPTMEWPLRAFVARAVARMAPVLFVISVTYWLAVSRPDSVSYAILVHLRGFFSIICSHLTLFMLATLIGSAGRRPRRWLVALGLQASFLALCFLVTRPFGLTPLRAVPWNDWLPMLAGAGPWLLDILSDLTVRELADAQALQAQNHDQRLIFAQAARLCVLAVSTGGVAWVVERRYRRNPMSLIPRVDKKAPSQVA